MRILFITNYYPPLSLGGYEQWCQEVANELCQRGHQILVLTTHAEKVREKLVSYDNVVVKDVLNLELDLEAGLVKSTIRMIKDRMRLEEESLHNIRAQINEYQPDVVMVWGMWNIPRSVPALLEELLPDRIIYYLCDYWPSLPNSYIQRWQEKSRNSLMSLPKRILSKPMLAYLKRIPEYELELRNSYCVSRRLRELLVQAGVPIEHAQVIYGGTKIGDFKRTSSVNHDNNGILKLLYFGRIRPDKGVHTIIEAVEQTLGKEVRVTLDIIGYGIPDYLKSLHYLIKSRQLQSAVTIKPGVPREQIPDLLSNYHVLVFPSIWEEPFARSVLEAMASELVVVGTTTGGTGEVLVEGKTGLTFPAGDARALSQKLIMLALDTNLRKRLATDAHTCVEKKFNFTRMVDDIEDALVNACAGRRNHFKT